MRLHPTLAPMRVLIVLLSLLFTPAASAQGFPLPHIDDLNFYAQIGTTSGSKDVSDNRHDFPPQFGWGFETSFGLLHTDSVTVELALGYEQLFLHEKLSSFELRGTLRDLPSSTIYISGTTGRLHPYLGFGTGVVSLANTTINDGTSRFSISGDTFDLDFKTGLAVGLACDGDCAKHERVNLFVEGAYHARFFGGVAYGSGAPPDLPGSLYFGGFVVSAGAQVALGAGSSSSPSSGANDKAVREEARRQAQTYKPVAPVDDQMLTVKSVCAGTDYEKTEYVVIDKRWDPGSCNKPESVELDVLVLARTDSAPDELEICASSDPLPDGWTKAGERWVPGRCGASADTIEKNIVIIRRKK